MKRFLTGVGILVLVTGLTSTKIASAAETVGTQSYEVTWHGLPIQNMGDKYQFYFSQADAPDSVYTIADGLNNSSRTVRLNYLKPCTSYNWSLKAEIAGTWRWVIQGRSFTTGGTCEQVMDKVTTNAFSSTAVTGDSSSTVSWMPVNGATKYHLYYGPKENMRAHSVVLETNSQSLTVNALNPKVTYYYQVAALVNRMEVWGPVKTLRNAGNTGQPVLGTTTYSGNQVRPKQANKYVPYVAYGQPQVAGLVNVLGATSKKGEATVSWTSIANATKYHVFYWSSDNDQHALRNLEPQASRVTISHLDPNKTYYYRVLMIKDGVGKWLSNAQTMMME